MDVPREIMGIYLTDICNYKCVFCSVDNPNRTKENIEKDAIFRILEDNKDKGYSGVALWGGEPTVRSDYFEIVEKVKACNYPLIAMETNGYRLADEEFLNKTIDQGVRYFIISFHGGTAEVQSQITQVPDSFDKVVKAITNLKKKGIFVRTNTVVNKLNYHQLPDIVKLLIDLEVDHLNVSGLRLTGNAAQNFALVTPTFTEMKDYVIKAFELVINSGKRLTFDVFPFCTIQGYEEYQLEWYKFKMFYGERVIADFADFTNNSLKAKGPMCRKCAYLNRCGGVFKWYIQNFGWGEFGYGSP